MCSKKVWSLWSKIPILVHTDDKVLWLNKRCMIKIIIPFWAVSLPPPDLSSLCCTVLVPFLAHLLSHVFPCHVQSPGSVVVKANIPIFNSWMLWKYGWVITGIFWSLCVLQSRKLSNRFLIGFGIKYGDRQLVTIHHVHWSTHWHLGSFIFKEEGWRGTFYSNRLIS